MNKSLYFLCSKISLIFIFSVFFVSLRSETQTQEVKSLAKDQTLTAQTNTQTASDKPVVPAITPTPTVAQQSVPTNPIVQPTQTVLKTEEKIPEKKTPQKKVKEPKAPDLINFSFDGVEIKEMVKRYAEKVKLNVIFPPTAMNEKISFNPNKPLTIKEAKRYLYMFLDYAGYTVLPGKDFVVVSKSDALTRSGLPLYVMGPDFAIKPEDLPDSDEPVRVIAYLASLRIDDEKDSPVMAILKDSLSEGESGPTSGPVAEVIVDKMLNAVIIADKSRIVRSTLQLLYELDTSGSKIILATVQLFNANAKAVVDLIKNQILNIEKTTDYPYGADSQNKPTFAGQWSYFDPKTRVVADIKRNIVMVLGREAPVNRLKDFIRDTLDIPLEKGASIFHVYDLKYLDADQMSTVLTNLIQSKSGGDSQVTAEKEGGTERFFEGVVVKAEKYEQIEATPQNAGGDSGSTGAASSGQVYRGGNRLLVAAKPSDWEHMKSLIEKLDVPQRQVIIEVLIVDYTSANTKSLNTQVRNTRNANLGDGVGAQAANVTKIQTSVDPVTGNPNPYPLGTTITGDLLRLVDGSSTIVPSTAGAFVLSLNDPNNTGIWGLVSLLNSLGHTEVISHPYLVALNNTPASISTTQIKRNEGTGGPTQGIAITINIEDVKATLTVGVTPRIASKEQLNLEISIDIQQFEAQTAQSFNRSTRTIKTNVNMLSPNQVLILGGLTKQNETDVVTEVPILGRIPLIGWLFRGRSKVTRETELGVFIRPTILEPKVHDVANSYTNGKVDSGAEGLLDAGMFGNQKDPIMRFFFGSEKSDIQDSKEYLNAVEHGRKMTQEFASFEAQKQAQAKDINS